jgi:hypothetical protein
MVRIRIRIRRKKSYRTRTLLAGDSLYGMVKLQVGREDFLKTTLEVTLYLYKVI